MNKVKKWLHDKLGWGFFNGKVDYNGSLGCSYCDRCITTDSTGALFHLSTKFKDTHD